MNIEISQGTYTTLASVADTLFRECEDDPACIARGLGRMNPDIREQLLVSDLLNAWQTFYYFFREDPGPDIKEILEFIPAGSLPNGVSIGEITVFSLAFIVEEGRPIILVSDDEAVLARFEGEGAFHAAREYAEENS